MKTAPQKTKIYNVIIMDRSGSMWEIQKPAIMGFNEVLGGVKANARKYASTQEHFMTLVLFDSDEIQNVYWNADPQEVQPLNRKTYVPGAATPLYDAMGRTLTALENELKDDDDHSVIITVITDGYENASDEYSLEALRSLIGHLKEDGWSFAYMGTDHDVNGVTVELSINNVVKFEKNEEDTMRSFRKDAQARACWSAELDSFMLREESRDLKARVAKRKIMAANYFRNEDEEKKPEKK